MLHYVHQQVANCVYLLFDAEQLPAVHENNASDIIERETKQ